MQNTVDEYEFCLKANETLFKQEQNFASLNWIKVSNLSDKLGRRWANISWGQKLKSVPIKGWMGSTTVANFYRLLSKV